LITASAYSSIASSNRNYCFRHFELHSISYFLFVTNSSLLNSIASVAKVITAITYKHKIDVESWLAAK